VTAFLPTTRVTVYRSTGLDAWGDETGLGGTAVATLVPASVVEQGQRSYLPSEQRGGVVERVVVRLRPGTDVREGDRIEDQAGPVYQVESVSNPQAVACLTDVRCLCSRTAATSTAP